MYFFFLRPVIFHTTSIKVTMYIYDVHWWKEVSRKEYGSDNAAFYFYHICHVYQNDDLNLDSNISIISIRYKYYFLFLINMSSTNYDL